MSRPYFETKIVKVGKKRELHINPRGAGKSTKYWSGFSDEVLERLEINAKRELERRKTVAKPKGNWVNGENLDEIKFPCFCSYVLNDMKWLGEINCSWQDFHGYTFYLSNIDEQKNTNLVEENGSIKDLIKKYDIHIKKGKIIIFDE